MLKDTNIPKIIPADPIIGWPASHRRLDGPFLRSHSAPGSFFWRSRWTGLAAAVRTTGPSSSDPRPTSAWPSLPAAL